MGRELRVVVERYYDALNRGALDALDDLVAPHLVHHGIPGLTGRDALKQTLRSYHTSFPDLAHSIDEILVEGDRAAVRSTTTGTHLGSFLGHPPSGRRFSAAAHSTYQIDRGLIHQIWEVFDTLGMLEQLGLYVPEPRSPALLRSPESTPGRLPPGPRADFSLAEIRSDPLRFVDDLVREYGNCVRYVCDGRETILLNQPRAIRFVLQDRSSNYSKLGTPDLLLLRPMLGDGLLTAVGPSWKQDRQLLQPAFARPQLEGSANVMVELAHEMVVRWRSRPDPDVPLDIVPEMSRLTLEIAARVLFSSDFRAHSEAFGKAMDVLNESMSHAQPGAVNVEEHFRPALEFIRRTVWQCILARKFCNTGEQDVLAALLQAQRQRGDSDRQVVDQAVTIILAGHETTAKALSWTIALLDEYPDVLARMVSEIDAEVGGRSPDGGDLHRLQYTHAVIQEALRLDPPIWMLTRTALEDDEIDGYWIPAGALIAISPYLMHRDPDLWDRPEEFLPDRFLATEEATHPDRFLPFGHGPRHCIGRYFAMLEMPLVLATIYSQMELRSSRQNRPEPEALVTLRPRHGLPMQVRSRQLLRKTTNGGMVSELAK